MHYWHTPYLGISAIPKELTQFELHNFFTFTPAEHRSIDARKEKLHRLGLALHVGFIRMSGRPLSSFKTIPTVLLRHLGRQLKIDVPDIVSIRAIYQRAKTLSDHQQLAAEILGFSWMSEHQRRALVRFLRVIVKSEFDRNKLFTLCKEWLYSHRLFIPHERDLRSEINAAAEEAESDLVALIQSQVPAGLLDEWKEALTQTGLHGKPIQQWLAESPRKQSLSQLKQQFDRVGFLTQLQVPAYPLPPLSDHARRFYAAALSARAPSVGARVKEPRRTLEAVCYLQMTLMTATDNLLAMTRQRIADLWNSGWRKANASNAERAKALVWLAKTVRELARNDELSIEKLRKQLLKSVEEVCQEKPISKAALTRECMLNDTRGIRSLLQRLCGLPFESGEDNAVLQAVQCLRGWYAVKIDELPPDVAIDVDRVWQAYLGNADRKRAMRAFELATLLNLRRALKSGAVYIEHSFSFRRRESMLIDQDEWRKSGNNHISRLKLSRDPKEFTGPLIQRLTAQMKQLDEIVAEGKVRVDDEMHISPLEAEEEHPDVVKLRRALFKNFDNVQLPEVLLEIDSQVRYSWVLLGREPRTVEELLLLYGGIIAQATAHTAAETARMMHLESPQSLRQSIGFLQREARLRKANDGVFEFMHRHPITEAWGREDLASADMMSVETAKAIWNSRADPRRKTKSHGLYSHVSSRWGIFYDQPIVLNERQCGVALEGAIRQDLMPLNHLAVDTHGYTDFGMLLAKLLGFDLCPHLRDLKQRRLYLPVGFDVPSSLRTVSTCTIDLTSFERQWDDFLRLTASVSCGKASAVDVLFRFGSAARGLPFYDAGVQGGRLLRTIFLCDWYTKPVFQRELRNVLNRGESLHTLQRTLHTGKVPAAHSRGRQHFQGVSSSLSLLSNIVMAWNTMQMQQALDALSPEERLLATPDNLRHVAPLGSEFINCKGELRFPWERYAARLLPNRGKIGARIRAV